MAATQKYELSGGFEPGTETAAWYVRRLLPSTLVCVPPYDRLTRCTFIRELPLLPRGSIVLLESRLPQDLMVIAAAAPTALLVVALRPAQIIGFSDLETLRSAGVTGVITMDHEAPDLPLLVAAARAASESLAGQLGPRLGLLGHSLLPECEAALERLVHAGPKANARSWAQGLGRSVRALERHCAERWHVPTPRRWVELVQVIHAVQTMQRRRDQSVEAALAAGGFANTRTVRELVRKITQVTPAQARNLIGWHWILRPWCEAFWNGTG